jgi:cation diffusion facilitator CzcD-associated flavoprotein CzcO
VGQPAYDAFVGDSNQQAAEHVDTLIVGAGISGLGAAWHLQHRRPDATFAIVDALETYGGTWWTHKYPGVRSDSDLFTLGYWFKPWTGKPIATAEQIRHYLGEVIEENDLGPHIRYRHRVTQASWSSDDRQWTVEVTDLATGSPVRFTCNFLWMCQGYYRHGQGYRPDWEGFDDFAGEVLHPQEWPDDADLKDKRVIVIGSGATAATLVPAISQDTAHVTMLQRSPTYFLARPNTNELADTLRSLDVPEEWTHDIVRRQMIKMTDELGAMCREYPDMAKQLLLEALKTELPADFDIDTHFTPAYRPWQQRLAALPDGDLFRAIRRGEVTMVTSTIERFVKEGIELTSGEVLEADVVITATGFDLSVFGDIDLIVDGSVVDPSTLVTYRGFMFTGLPNMAYVFGYFRASWTLRADIISDFVCRLLDGMGERGHTMVVPTLLPDEQDMARLPWVETENFNPGYLGRSMHLMPSQGDHEPWKWGADYSTERQQLAEADLDDGRLRFS